MVRKRGGWLAILFLGEMLTATAMGFFEGEIEKAAVVALFVPLLRLGARLFPITTRHGLDLPALAHSPVKILAASPQLAVQIGGMAGQALFAWLLLAVPVVVLLTPALAVLLRRVPALAAVESGD